ncbi:hypothetical protein ACIREM_32860 [Streptomyces shenzhenensis]|uniref:hypothetical protein n=1 Tax=Streptomyces shenzhenensis TaxID=943815 RepID=UPI00380461FC
MIGNVAVAVLVVLPALAVGWCIGYRTRPQPRRTWACAVCDQVALQSEHARFDELEASLDLNLPDNPRNAA